LRWAARVCTYGGGCMKTIRTYGNLAAAGFDQSLLEASGIEAALLDENTATSGIVFIPTGMRLQVADEDVERALEVLSQRVPDSMDTAPAEAVRPEHEVDSMVRAAHGVKCPECGTLWELSAEQVSAGEFTCPDCRATVPIPVAAQREEAGVCATCPECGTEWELTPEEAAQGTFTCGDCKTTFPIGEVQG
jgi:uncharacterized protein YbaR (Trm112 family)